LIREAVVMAAGEGRRLRPLSERYAKPVLPIDGRPVVVGVLRDLAEAGIERAWVVTGHLAEQVERLLAGGREAFGLEVRFVRQPRAGGSADTVRRALAAGAEPPVLVVAADTRFSPGDVTRFAAAAEGFDGAIAGRSDPPPGPGRPPLELADGRVVRVIGDPAPGRLSGAPLWAVTAALADGLDALPGPPYELATLFQRGVDRGLAIAGVEIGKTRDLTTPFDVIAENFTYLGVIE
jgi:NDP-sugar pyrophosphorylase family protein